MNGRGGKGYSLVELLVGLTVFSLAVVSVVGLLIHNARLNKSQQMTGGLQSSARICLEMVQEKLRTAGWDPLTIGFSPVALDSDLSDPVSYIEVFADLNEDGDTADLDEAVLIRHIGDRVEWRRSSSGSFEILAVDISNDSDGDSNPEPMFVPDSVSNPTQIAVRITAQSPVPDPVTGSYIRYTVNSEVALRNAL